MPNNIFERTQQECTKKKIKRLCNKLQKKCSFKSGANMKTLCELAYWLYIYNDREASLKICEYTHIDDPLPLKVDYRVWDYILWIWGLEAYILKQQRCEEKSRKRIQAINRVSIIPSAVFDTISKREAQKKRIAERLTYEDATQKLNISDGDYADEYRLTALYKMIGYGITGFYPHLVKNSKQLQEDIEEYIYILSTK